MTREINLIARPNAKLCFHVDLPHAPRLRDQPHQALPDVLDLVVHVEEADVAPHGGSGVGGSGSFFFLLLIILYCIGDLEGRESD